MVAQLSCVSEVWLRVEIDDSGASSGSVLLSSLLKRWRRGEKADTPRFGRRESPSAEDAVERSDMLRRGEKIPECVSEVSWSE